MRIGAHVTLVKEWIKNFQHFTNRSWYEWVLAILAGADIWIVVIPTDGLVISSVLLAPKKWFRFWILTALGSTLGAMTFILAIASWGMPWLQLHWPEMMASSAWVWTENLFSIYGLWFVFGIASAPLIMQPALALAVASHHSVPTTIFVVLGGRFVKYGIMASVARWAPGQISRLWGVKDELDDVRIEK